MLLVIPTTTIPVSGATGGGQCTNFAVPPESNPDYPDGPTYESCCPEGQVWEWGQHSGPGQYWDCVPGNQRDFNSSEIDNEGGR